jgi:hypothetical protein
MVSNGARNRSIAKNPEKVLKRHLLICKDLIYFENVTFSIFYGNDVDIIMVPSFLVIVSSSK